MLVLVTYDVETITPQGQKRLRKVAKECMNHGRRVQNSVFECIIDYTQFTELKLKLKSYIDEAHDSIRFYNFGNKYNSKVDFYGKDNGNNVEDELII